MKETFKQQRSLFFRNVIAFALIFMSLGLIVNHVLTISLYKDVDEELTHLSSDNQFIQMELQHFKNQTPPQDIKKERMQPSSFKTQMILWSEDGKILNKEEMGDRFYEFSNLSLQPTKEEKIVDLEVKNSHDSQLNFRSITKAIDDPGVAYIQFISNTNQTKDTMHFFRVVLVICMIVFWIISIFVSYYLAKWNMKPIIISWEKQQEFVENSSHELRTPLTIIQAKLEKLFTRPNHTIIEESEDIALALNEVRRLSQLTNDLLLIARSDGNEIVLEKQTVDSFELMRKIISPYQEVAISQEKKLALVQPSAQEMLIDPKLITQLIIILVDNALKYTKAQDSITVTSAFIDKKWQISVADTGIGLKLANKKLIFERFYRADQSRGRETGGYGLGLSIAKWIVEMHQGQITVADNEPKGTLLTVTLPMVDK